MKQAVLTRADHAGRVMLWGCLSAAEVRKLVLTELKHRAILEENLSGVAKDMKLRQRFTLQLVNNDKQTVRDPWNKWDQNSPKLTEVFAKINGQFFCFWMCKMWQNVEKFKGMKTFSQDCLLHIYSIPTSKHRILFSFSVGDSNLESINIKYTTSFNVFPS